MYSLIVKGNQTLVGHEIPIIEGGFGKQQRIIMAKTIAEIHNTKTADINRLINNNLNNLAINVDFLNIIDLLVSNKQLRDQIGIRPLEISSTTKAFYILSERGYMKLVAAMSNTNDTKWDVMKTFIDKYFKMRTYLEDIAGKLIPPNEVNEILKLANQNPYIKEYTRILVPPRGKIGKQFKQDEINQFFIKVNRDVESYLISSLGVPDLENIPQIAYKSACFLVKECYTLPENLKTEFSIVFEKLLETREKVIKDNQLKNVKIVQSFAEELDKVKLVIKGLLF